MSSETGFLLVIVVIMLALGSIVVIIQAKPLREWISRQNLQHLPFRLPFRRKAETEPASSIPDLEPGAEKDEDENHAEFDRLQSQIHERKKIAWDTDISYHLWDFYRNHFRPMEPPSEYIEDGKWYQVKILQTSSVNGLNRFEFELKGEKYQFTEDEERQGWRDKTKTFSLCLFDSTDRCLIDIPIKMRVDKMGRNYSVLSGGPEAFLPGEWINDFINVKLKHQHIRNREIREQKQQQLQQEIEDMKDRFGLKD